MSEKINVLYVDDEENNLTAFKSFFRKEYKVFTANSAEKAFEVLEQETIHIIITDQRMPVMSGVEFLEKTIKRYPDAIRLLITGHTDIGLVIEAINNGQITKYIEKPWDWDKLRLILEYSADLYNSRREIKLKNAELFKTNQELNRFIYSASHDLRSPLLSILGIVQLAKHEGQGDNKYMDLIENSVYKLDNFVRNIIDYYQNSRSEAIIEVIDFKLLIEEIISLIKSNTANEHFEIQINQDVPFYGDPFRTRMVLSNIISNAWKYKDPSRNQHNVKITVSVDKETCTVSISDNGIGISPDHLQDIFKMFYRAQKINKQQGSGLGLFIVKEIVDNLGGSINVQSQPSEGTVFDVTLPNCINEVATAPVDN